MPDATRSHATTDAARLNVFLPLVPSTTLSLPSPAWLRPGLNARAERELVRTVHLKTSQKPRYGLMTTGTPSGSALAKRVIPVLLMRMQPWLTSFPIDDGSFVPWIPTTPSPPAKSVSTFEYPDRP